VAQPLALTAVGWPLGELLGSFPWGVLGGVVGASLVVLWRARRDRQRWAEQRAVDRALREHVDPGPDHRSATAQAARLQLARPAGALVAGVVIVGLLVAACARTALERDDVTVALSAIPLLVAFVAAVLHQRRQDARAARWLDDPPFPVPEEDGP